MNTNLTQLLNKDKEILNHTKIEIQRKENLLFELTELNNIDKLTVEQYNCAMSWLNHSNLSVKEIIEKI